MIRVTAHRPVPKEGLRDGYIDAGKGTPLEELKREVRKRVLSSLCAGRRPIFGITVAKVGNKTNTAQAKNTASVKRSVKVTAKMPGTLAAHE